MEDFISMKIVFVVWPTAHKLFQCVGTKQKRETEVTFQKASPCVKTNCRTANRVFSTKFRLQEQSCSSLQEERVALVIDPDFVFSSSCEAANCPSDNTALAVNSPNRAFLFTPRSDHSSKDSPLI